MDKRKYPSHWIFLWVHVMWHMCKYSCRISVCCNKCIVVFQQICMVEKLHRVSCHSRLSGHRFSATSHLIFSLAVQQGVRIVQCAVSPSCFCCDVVTRSIHCIKQCHLVYSNALLSYRLSTFMQKKKILKFMKNGVVGTLSTSLVGWKKIFFIFQNILMYMVGKFNRINARTMVTVSSFPQLTFTKQ